MIIPAPIREQKLSDIELGIFFNYPVDLLTGEDYRKVDVETNCNREYPTLPIGNIYPYSIILAYTPINVPTITAGVVPLVQGVHFDYLGSTLTFLADSPGGHNTFESQRLYVYYPTTAHVITPPAPPQVLYPQVWALNLGQGKLVNIQANEVGLVRGRVLGMTDREANDTPTNVPTQIKAILLMEPADVFMYLNELYMSVRVINHDGNQILPAMSSVFLYNCNGSRITELSGPATQIEQRIGQVQNWYMR